MDSAKTVAIINTQASRVERQLGELKEKLQSNFSDLEIVEIDKSHTLQKEVSTVLKKSPEKIIAVGGDGTILSVIKQADSLGFDKPVGIIPLGTANYLARNLGFDLTIDDAIRRIVKGDSKKLYIPEADGHFFTLMLTVGLTTEISKNIEVKFKQRYGQFAYVFEAFRQLARNDSFEYTITLDGEREISGTTHQIVVANADLNSQLQVVPSSKIDTPTLKLSVYKTNNSKLRLLIMIFGYILTFGRYKKGLTSTEAKRIQIKTKPKQSAAVDGEPELTTPLDIKMHDRAVTLYS